MKIIRVSCYDDEGPRGDKHLVGGPGWSIAEAEVLCDKLCNSLGRPDDWWYRVVPDDHKLREFEP